MTFGNNQQQATSNFVGRFYDFIQHNRFRMAGSWRHMMPVHSSAPRFVVLTLLCFIGLWCPVESAELVERSIVHDNLTRWFLEYRPDSIVDSDTATPLVILLHGGTQSMRAVTNRGNRGTNRWMTLSDTYGFLLLVPNGVNLETGDTYGDNQNWSDVRLLNGTGLKTYDDVGFLSLLVTDYAVAEQNVDPARVFVTGSSNGGLMTYSMLLYAPELFTAGAAFIANLPNQTIPYPNQSTPLMIMNGNEDPLMKWNGGAVPSQVGGVVRSAHETRDFWIRSNQASSSDVMLTTLPNRNWFDRCRIRSEYYPPNTTSDPLLGAAAPVHFYEMDGGGHSIPSRRGFFSLGTNLYDLLIGGNSCHDVNGADVAWDFFMTNS